VLLLPIFRCAKHLIGFLNGSTGYAIDSQAFTYTGVTYIEMLSCFRKRVASKIISNNIIFDLFKIQLLPFTHCLFAFLIFYVAFDRLKSYAAHSTDKIRIRPEARKFLLEVRELLPQLMGGGSLHELYQAVDTKLRITANYQMHMIRHDFHLYKFLLPSLHTFLDERLQSGIDRWKQDLASVLWAKDHMVVAIVDDVIVTVNYCLHTQIIAENSSFVKRKLLNGDGTPVPKPQERNGTLIPVSEGQGFSRARIDKRRIAKGCQQSGTLFLCYTN
jgi:hypothetical protein